MSIIWLLVTNSPLLPQETDIYLLYFYPNHDTPTTESHSVEGMLGVLAPDVGLLGTVLNFHCEQRQLLARQL